MSLLSSLFKTPSKKEQKNNMPKGWHTIDNIAIIDDICRQSKKETILIFKHSTRCPISDKVLKAFALEYQQKFPVYYLNLIKHRDMSNAIAETFKVTHQSPQLLVIKNERCIVNASHQDILNLELPD